jgi:hypothetical protein
MVVVVVVVMVMMAATAMMPATATIPAAIMMPAATMPAAAMAVTGLGPRQCQPSARPRSGIRLIRSVEIDIHAQADREGQCRYSVFHSR